MGRVLTVVRHQMLIDDWAEEVLALPWGRAGAATDLSRLTILVGNEWMKLGPTSRRKMKVAASELRDLLGRDGPQGRSIDTSAALKRWIDRRLVTLGDDLIVPEALRRARLDRLRDRDRRKAHTRRGLHAVRVEMPAASWAKLKKIGLQLEGPSLGANLALVIDAYVRADKAGPPKKARPVQKAERQDDLLAAEPAARGGDGNQG